MTRSIKVELRDTPLSVAECVDAVSHAGAGGIDVFVGVVRDRSDGRAVSRLEYSAYASMAALEMERIVAEIEREMAGVRVAVQHRVGALVVGDAAVVCAASAEHRGEAFTACRFLIDRVKARVPIWKREHGPDGALWVGWVDARCGEGHDHAADAHHAHATAATLAPPPEGGPARSPSRVTASFGAALSYAATSPSSRRPSRPARRGGRCRGRSP